MSPVRIPATGDLPESILASLAAMRGEDARYREGRTWSMIYYAGDGHHQLVQAAHDLYLAENALNPMAFKSLRRMEVEVVQMASGLLNGPPSTVGCMTSGGTESLILAMKTWRDAGLSRRPWLRSPEVVLPRTAHPAFDKAAHMLGMRLRKAEIGADGRVDLHHVGRLIGRRTVLLVGSAPQYPHGTVDPIPQLGELAARHGIPLHVDACFGGFILPWLERLGVVMPAWDLRVPQVRSISADLHKYGYAAKGAAVLLYRRIEDMKHQFFVTTDWPGGIYASPGLAGTRPGGPIAAAWAALHAMGEQGYLERAGEAWQVAERLRAGVRAIPGLHLLGRPESPIVTWAADPGGPDVYAIADLLQAAGWSVDRQQAPASVHCSTNAVNLQAVDRYLADLAEAADRVRSNPSLSGEGQAAMYGMMAKVPVNGLVQREVRKVMEKMYGPDGAPPELGGEALPPWAGKALDLFDRARRRVRGGRG